MDRRHPPAIFAIPHIALASVLACASIGLPVSVSAEPDETEEQDSESTVEAAGEDEGRADPFDAPAISDAPAPRNARAIEEIIVTATKRETSVRDIAGSVSALTGTQIEDRGLQSINEIADEIPGVNLVETGAVDTPKRITIRGISAGTVQNDTVGVFIDETPFTDVFFAFVTADANPFDMSSVEILKGPVGTLFGGSALNGAIRYIPQRPVFGEWQTKTFSQYQFNSQSEDIGRVFGAAVNVPILDDLAFRIVANDRLSQGWVDSFNQAYEAKDVNRIKQQSFRGILRWQPLEQLDLSLMYLNQDTRVLDTGLADLASAPDYSRTAHPQPWFSTTNYQTFQLKGTWSFDWADLVLVASASDKQYDSLNDVTYLADSDPASSAAIGTANSDGQPRSQELRLVSAVGGDWNWIGGLYNYKYSVFGEVDISTSQGLGQTEAIPTDIIADVTEKAAFGELSYRITNGLELTGGFRLYEFSYIGEMIISGPGCVLVEPTCPGTDASGLRGVLKLNKTERGTSPKLSLKWEIDDEWMAYATGARGFRFGGVNGALHPEIPVIYESDSLWSYELGTRALWLNGLLTTDATVFVIDWRDAQYRTQTSDGVASYTDNVGAVSGKGLEGQVVWLTPIEGVSLSLTPAYALIETAKDFSPPSSTGSGPTVPAGTPWPRAPKWQTSATLGWSGQFGRRLVDASLTHRYFGKAIQGFAPTETQTIIFGYASWDIQMAIKNAADGWWPDLVLNLNNITDTQGLTYAGFPPTGPNGGSLRSYSVPRSASLRLSLDF